MTRNSNLSSINCTSCGAGLDVLGGGRVTTHICSYCGTALDAQHDYAILKSFANADRPDTPFKIGMQGKIWNANWTIIGIMRHEEQLEGRTRASEWVDHQLFSPTHGYAWLTLENGHTTISRRSRDLGPSSWISETWVNTAETPPFVHVQGRTFTYFETTTSLLTYAEGEFTFTPKIDEATTSVSAMSGETMLNMSQSASEREAFLTHYLPAAEIGEIFGIDPNEMQRPSGLHAMSPFTPGKHIGFLRNACGVFTIICVALALFLMATPGTKTLPRRQLEFDALPVSLPFEVNETQRMSVVSLSSRMDNAWADIPIEITSPDGETLFETGRVLEAYSGREGNENWSERKNSTKIRFTPTTPGRHTLTISKPETGQWQGRISNPTALTVEISSGHSSGLWLVLLAVLFGLMSLWHMNRKRLHFLRRWRKTDWSDD